VPRRRRDYVFSDETRTGRGSGKLSQLSERSDLEVRNPAYARGRNYSKPRGCEKICFADFVRFPPRAHLGCRYPADGGVVYFVGDVQTFEGWGKYKNMTGLYLLSVSAPEEI